MVNRPKDQGTAFETLLVNKANQHGHLRAQRAPNHAPHRDVEVRLDSGLVVPVEAKARANLNLHKLASTMAAAGQPPVIAWKRLSRKDGNTRRTADGPPMVAMSLELWLDVMDDLSLYDEAYGTCLPDWFGGGRVA